MLLGVLLKQWVPKTARKALLVAACAVFAGQTMSRCAAWHNNYRLVGCIPGAEPAHSPAGSLHEAGYAINPSNVKLAPNLGMLKAEVRNKHARNILIVLNSL